MKIEEFINKHLNKIVDFDGAFGGQCVDVFRQYCKDVLEIPHTGAVEGAKDLFLNYDNMPLEKEHFQKMLSTYYLYGDVVVWDKSMTNKYGHVAIFIHQISNGEILVLEQDGFKQNGLKLKSRSTNNILGILRPKVKVG